MCGPQFSTNKFKDHCSILQSLPSRGAWIEMEQAVKEKVAEGVAPLTGSVDRNHSYLTDTGKVVRSLPSRGAWIEMSLMAPDGRPAASRSPHGERG